MCSATELFVSTDLWQAAARVQSSRSMSSYTSGISICTSRSTLLLVRCLFYVGGSSCE